MIEHLDPTRSQVDLEAGGEGVLWLHPVTIGEGVAQEENSSAIVCGLPRARRGGLGSLGGFDLVDPELG